MTTQTRRSPLATIRQHMTIEQARIATRGMDADEMARLAWTLDNLDPRKVAEFIAGMTTDPEG